jgi:hypothetical protein
MILISAEPLRNYTLNLRIGRLDGEAEVLRPAVWNQAICRVFYKHPAVVGLPVYPPRLHCNHIEEYSHRMLVPLEIPFPFSHPDTPSSSSSSWTAGYPDRRD